MLTIIEYNTLEGIIFSVAAAAALYTRVLHEIRIWICRTGLFHHLESRLEARIYYTTPSLPTSFTSEPHSHTHKRREESISSDNTAMRRVLHI